MRERLFSYGTLQLTSVQIESFGRELQGRADTLVGYVVGEIEIVDEAVLAVSGERFHPILQYSGNDSDQVDGMVFEISTAELAQADHYEVDAYARIWSEHFVSGIGAWLYVDARETIGLFPSPLP
ncbi:MAG: gamma-glutamylcyclotransferase [Zetaproteobacteria bacterium]|nr:gamma-glutamylcyclotransferase [Zetaproteobacteria bacterium]